MKASMLHTTLWLFGGMLPLAPLTAISLTFNMMKHYHSLIDRWSKSFQVNPGVPHVSQPFMQDSLWQCFLAWRAASRPVHPSALHHFALQSGIQSRSVFHRCLEQFVVLKCPEFWGSSKQHPMWSLNILISTRWRTFGSQLRLPRQFREWNRSPTERTVKSQDTVRYCKIFYDTWIFNTKYWTRWCIMNSFSLGGADCRWIWWFLQIVPPWHSLSDAHVTLWDEIRDHYMDRSDLSVMYLCVSFGHSKALATQYIGTDFAQRRHFYSPREWGWALVSCSRNQTICGVGLGDWMISVHHFCRASQPTST